MAAWSLLLVLVGLHVVAAGLVLTHATEGVLVDLDWMRSPPQSSAEGDCTKADRTQAPGEEEAPLTRPQSGDSVTPPECRRESSSNE